MDAAARVEVGERARDVGREGDADIPREGLAFVVDVEAEVAAVDELGDNEDAVVGFGSAAETDEQDCERQLDNSKQCTATYQHWDAASPS